MKSLLSELKTRLRVALHVLRGKPTMFRTSIETSGGVIFRAENGLYLECLFTSVEMPVLDRLTFGGLSSHWDTCSFLGEMPSGYDGQDGIL